MRDNKSKLAEIMDAVLLLIVLAAVLFLAARTVTGTLNAAVCGVTAAVCLLHFIGIKSNKKKLSLKEKRQMEQTFSRLIFSSNDFRLDYFARLLERFAAVEKREGYIKTPHKRVYCLFSPLQPDVRDVMPIYDDCVKNDCKAVVLTPYAPDKEAAAFTATCGRIKILYGEKLYSLIKDAPPPSQKENVVKKKGSFVKLLSAAIDRSLFRRYLFAAVLLLGASYILPQNILYIATGCLCLVLSLVCLLNFKSGKRRAKTSKP